MIKKGKSIVLWIYVISALNGTEIVLQCFTKKICQKKNQKEFRVENVIKGKRDKLYVKWKGYNNSFNSRVDIKKSFNKMS